MKPFPQLNKLIKCFDKINENVEVNRAPVRICHSGRAGDSGRDTFENENLITRKIKIKPGVPGFRFGLANRIGPGSGVATTLLVSEPRFRRFYKVILKLFVNDFEIVYDMHCICI